MELLTDHIYQLTNWIAENQHRLGDVNADLSLADGARGTFEGVRLMLHNIGGIDESPVGTYGVTPLMSP